MNMKKRILLGMSGGVDSSVSAVLLQKQGYEVIGATMNMWTDTEKSIEDAKKVCQKLGIEHHVIDCIEKFRCNVINKFISEYENAKTPNPCVECNRYLKFGAFYEKAKELGCEYIATGHYAKTEYSEKYKRYVLKKSDEIKKDQTYFLYYIPKEEIEYIVFPLQNRASKEETRKIAEETGLEVAQKKDSQEICFIPDNDYQGFLQKHSSQRPKSGNIVLKDGTILGKHNGLINYTIGQRKGLGISYKEPLYVIKLDIQKNQVIVGTEQDLYSKELIANEINWLAINELKEPLRLTAKVRYRAKEAQCVVYPIEENQVKVIFDEPQRAITPGQSVVFYDENIVVGGGKIIYNKNVFK